MIDFQHDVFHVGIRVPDIDAAMAELSDGLGLTWAKKMDREQHLWTPEGGAVTTRLLFTYSCEGPQHLELLQGEPGSIWDGDDRTGAHHVGVWVDDVAAETERLVGLGWTLEAAGKPPEDGYGSMTYVRSPQGLLVEPVTSRAKGRFDVWFAGGDLA